MMPSSCRQVNCGIPWVNCTVLCVWKTGKDSSEACDIAFQNCEVYLVFPSGTTSRSKIVQFNWKCVGRFTLHPTSGNSFVCNGPEASTNILTVAGIVACVWQIRLQFGKLALYDAIAVISLTECNSGTIQNFPIWS